MIAANERTYTTKEVADAIGVKADVLLLWVRMKIVSAKERNRGRDGHILTEQSIVEALAIREMRKLGIDLGLGSEVTRALRAFYRDSHSYDDGILLVSEDESEMGITIKIVSELSLQMFDGFQPVIMMPLGKIYQVVKGSSALLAEAKVEAHQAEIDETLTVEHLDAIKEEARIVQEQLETIEAQVAAVQEVAAMTHRETIVQDGKAMVHDSKALLERNLRKIQENNELLGHPSLNLENLVRVLQENKEEMRKLREIVAAR